MKRTKNRILSVFLSFCMIVSCMVGISITAGAAGSVSFLDADGTDESCTTYTSVTESTTAWSTGWYVVDSTTQISQRVTVTGDVHLILCDGKTLTAENGITVEGENNLTIYAQSTAETTRGVLSATGGENQAGIGGGKDQDGGTITINGGEVVASSTGYSAIDGTLTVADGLTVFGDDSADPTTVRTNFVTTRWKYMTVKAIPLEPVSYLDETGTEQTCTDYIVVTEATTLLTDGNWYVVNSDVTLTDDYGFPVVGDANLILCDGAKLTVNGGIRCINDGGFTIYAQSTGENMGKLIATYNEDDGYSISQQFNFNRIITINGGDIQATGSPTNTGASDTGIINYGNPVIINGGKVTASGNDYGIYAKSVTINGGEVIASSTASSAIYGTLTVADGLTVFGDDSADPTTVRTDYATTRWKYMTVKAIPPEPVSYLDEDGETETCTDYIVVAEAIGELTDGNWYVFNSDVTITGCLYVNGDVNLILCDGAKLTVNGGIECFNDGGFTIYAQSTGENMGKLIATYGVKEYGIGNGDSHYNRTITINGGDIQATGSPTKTSSNAGAGILNFGNPVIINGGKVTASGYDHGIYAKSVTINGGEVVASGNDYGINAKNDVTINGGEVTVSSNGNGIYATDVTINGGEVVASVTTYKAIRGTLTVADGLTVFGDDSADPTTVRTDYATTRWKYMTVKAAELYSVTLTGGANATPDPAEGVSQTDIYGDMATVVYTANPGYYFEEFADITVNGITATRINAETVKVSGTPTDDAVLAVPDATAAFSSTVNVVWSETVVNIPEELTATLAGVDSYTLNAENSWSHTVTGLTKANNNWSIECPVGYSVSSSTEGAETTFTFTDIPMPSPESVTADSITLKEVTGYEYSKDNGETWQDSPTFTGLAPGTDYQFVQRPKGTTFKSQTNEFGILAFYVKFIVVNGKWDDGTDAEKTVVLARVSYEDLALTLESSDIPAVGSKPDNGYKAGSWDTVPTTEAVVSDDKTFTYTYAEKTTPTITAVPTASTITYGHTLADSTLTGGSATSGNEAVQGTFTWTTPATAPAVADSDTTEYDVTFTPDDTDNYTTAACKVKLTVGKAEPTITTAPTASAVTYGQTLADSTLSGGAASVQGTFTWATPTTAPAVADSNTTEYDVTFTPNDTDNYTTAACKVKLTVGKAEPTITIAPTASAITYGQTLADSTLSGGAASVQGTFTWTTPTTAPAVADSGTTLYEVKFTPTDTANYKTVTCNVTLTVNKATPTITTAPTASAITYGQKLSDSTLSGGAASVSGTFTWTTPATAPAVADSNTTEYDVTFTPNDTDNYTTAACKVKLTVGKAEPTITTAPTASAITYGQTLADSTLSGGAASVQGTFTWTTPATAPAVADSGTTEYDVTFTPNDTDNYTIAACKVTLTVNKAEPTITTAPTANELTYTGDDLELVTAGTVTGGRMVYGTDGTHFGENIPTGKDAKEYTVYYMADGDENHKDTEPASIKVTIAKADSSVTTAPTANELTYTGDDLELVTAGTVTGGRMVYGTDGTHFGENIPTGKNAGEYTVYYMADGDENHNDTEPASIKVTIAKADQSAPAVTAVAETIKGKADGKITGVNATMEYRADNENGYNPVTGTVITNLEPGIYHVRVKEDDNHFASPDATVTVEEGRMLTVTFKTDSTTVYTTAECEYKGTVSAPAKDPEMEKHRFKYWQLGGERFDFSTEITEDIVLIARWEGTYAIKVIRGTADKTSAEAGETVRIQADVLSNMYFCDWDSAVPVEFENSREITTTFTMPASDVVISAYFNPLGPDKPKPSGGSSTSITPSPAWTEPSKDTEADIPELSITGVQDAQNQSALAWDSVPNASGYALYVKVDGKYVFLQDIGDNNHVDVILSTNGKYYVSTGDKYNVYSYDKKTASFKKTGTLKADKIDTIKVKNNVTNNFMVKYTVGGTESTEKQSMKVAVKIYYKPAPKATVSKGTVTLKWAKVSGATKYGIYKYVNGKLKLVAETKKLSAKINGTKAGQTYTYAVKAFVNGEWTTVNATDLVTVTAK